MAEDPVTAGLTLVDKLFSFFTGEKWDAILDRHTGDALEKAANDTLRAWKDNPTDENWRVYKHAVQALIDWSNTP